MSACVPVSMIVPGVLPGSNGPLFYPADEVAASASAWNGVPVTLNHPMQDGQHVSASVAGERLGIIKNARFVNGKLVAEACFTGPIPAGLVEISTGLHLDVDARPGVHNGIHYIGIARRYRPDHLAILAAGRGACGVVDGCGLNVNHQHWFSNRKDFPMFATISGGYANFAGLAPPTVNQSPTDDVLDLEAERRRYDRLALNKAKKTINKKNGCTCEEEEDEEDDEEECDCMTDNRMAEWANAPVVNLMQHPPVTAIDEEPLDLENAPWRR